MYKSKLIRMAIVAIFLSVAGGCSSTGKNVNTNSVDQGLETRVYEVFGMDCPGCHGGVEKLVMKIQSVDNVTANWSEQQLVVMVKQGMDLNDDEIYDAVQRANFTVGKRVK
jgi:copper chaperone CopZ